ncbi:N-acetylmuramoyl-L-alanine amidase [Celeribacter marinus]|uniref:N-acetylmuramoyl-L-alanine amidase n=1 Tax=Celeribacter marinus TaxID=1397108 RepID=A0A0P0A8P9_9RHOB|nr:N-acetylmuramoyl-L-alanine amidase [Celeribacter marinus]ALI54929.1 N-acetylmuramoyl-L-alanine amidase [Celeribacter marinus]
MTSLTIHDHPSPNFGARRGGVRPDMVVLHYTAMALAHEACARLCAPEFEVSAHYLIDETGSIYRLVDENDRAWHAGAGQWGDVTDVNSHSIGIELSNTGTTPFAAAQMNALEALLADILARHAIAPERVIGHSDMAPSRKIDPGARFDWRRLARQGLSVWPEVQRVSAVCQASFDAALDAFGYAPCQTPDARLKAFRDRFRGCDDGPLDGYDVAMAQNLAARFPVDRRDVNT